MSYDHGGTLLNCECVICPVWGTARPRQPAASWIRWLAVQSHVGRLVLVTMAVAALSVCVSLAQGGRSTHSGCAYLTRAQASRALAQPVVEIAEAGQTGILATSGAPALPAWSSCYWKPTTQPTGVTSTLTVEVAGPFSSAGSAVGFYKAVRSNCGAVTGFAPNACLWTGAIARLKVRSWMLEQSSGRVTVAISMLVRTDTRGQAWTTKHVLPVLENLMRSALPRIPH
jgi:hypothetical protein